MWSRARGSASSRSPKNLADLLELRAHSHAEEGYSYLLGPDVDGPRAELSFADLYRRARDVAALLDRAGARNERVVLVFAPGLEFIVGLFGCLLAGAVAVPVYPPNPSRLYKTLPLLEAIASNAEARFALTSPDLLAMASAVAELSEGLAKLEWLSIAEGGDGDNWEAPELGPDQLAFLQYTSGSTGVPKGVMLSHANLLRNEAMIQIGFSQGSHARLVGWLPLYHDMGLIGNVLNPMWVGGSVLLLSPISFIKRPMIWLEAISNFRARTSGGPNFAYDLCVDRLEPELLKTLDLSCWSVAFSGAEPVRAATLERFSKTFESAGFKARSLFPCYGLAESTLAVTASDFSQYPRVVEAKRSALEARRFEPAELGEEDRAVSLVSSGKPVLGCEVKIVDPERHEVLASGEVGEICIRGEHVAGGYWARAEQSKATFELELPGTDPENPAASKYWLRSGDLGFLDGGELFVCGRHKDLLIVRGRNLHPHDLERAISDASPSIRTGCVVAFATEYGAVEEIVIVAEIRDATPPDALGAIVGLVREVLSDGFGVRPLEVVLVGMRSLPKTSSGKLRRSATRDVWRGGRLERLVHADREPERVEVEPPRNIVEARVLEICAEILEQPNLSREDDFFKLGADSVAIASMTAKLEQVLGREIPLGAVFDAPSVAGLSDWLREDGYDTTRLRARELPLTVDMRRLLQVAGSRDLPVDSLHISAAFSVRGGGMRDKDLRDRLMGALRSFSARHGALRTCFAQGEEGELKQLIQAGVLPALGRHELASLEEVERRYAEIVRRPFELGRGPLWRFELLELAGSDPVLCVVAHHLVSDHASFRILVSELEAELAGNVLLLGAPDDAGLVSLANSETKIDVHAAESFEGIEQLSFAALTGRPPDAQHAAGSVFVDLDPTTNSGIDALARSLGVLPAALGFAVLQLLLHRICGVERFVVGVPVDQRIALGTPDAVGYFGVPVPVACEVHPSDTPRVLTRRTQGQLRRIMDAPGMPGTLSATLERALGRSPGVPLLQVLFNVLPSAERGRSPRGPKLQRLPFGPVSLDVDLSLALIRNQNGGAIELHHRLDVLDRRAARQLVEAYVELLSSVARDIDTPLSHHRWPDSCPAAPPRRRVALASTFTADPMFTTIVGWGRMFDCPFEVEPAGYGQVIQPLLNPASALRSEDVVARVLLVRLLDVFRERNEPATLDDYRDWCADLLDGVREAAGAGLTIIGMPPSEIDGDLLELELELAEGLASISGVNVLDPQRMLAGLNVDAVFDPQAEELAHMPYTAPAYAALATAVVRELWRHDRQPLKLVAVDADNSLWSGVVGEDGPQGLDPKPFSALHRRLRQCSDAGVLLAIISNNDPDMVREALQHPDLPNVDDFIAIEGGYHSKADRLIGVAEHLSLGVESFCYLDDNEVEVAAMRDACPEALVFQLPEPAEIEGFVRRLWGLDVGRHTMADRERPRRYVEELARRSSRLQGQGHLDFVRSLELRVTPRALERHLERAAQLSARTNQFNLRKRPRTADELAQEVDDPDVFGAVFEVHDRFGDYGVVGLILARARDDELVVETLLLSCRVLGRGVELELLRWLAEQAEAREVVAVRLLAEASPRNTPARRFVRRVGDAGGGELVETGAGSLELRVRTSGLRGIGLQALLERVETVTSDSSARRLDIDRRLEARRLAWVATQLCTGEDVLRAFGIHWLRPGSAPKQIESGAELTIEIVGRMAALLRVEQFDSDASFLAAGASSLTAVELLADLRRDLDLNLSLDDLIAAPSARALAAVAVGIRGAKKPEREMSLPERLATDAQLDPAIAPESPRTRGASVFRRVLLTGVTGFVGAHLLFELLRQTEATVVCLIRARDVEHGWERLRAALERVELTWSTALRRRVEILPGDLSTPRLGLGGDAWRREASELDAIYHCGASVNFAQPYEMQRGPNVEGTRSLIELACAEQATPLHYVSTMGVLIGPGCLDYEVLEEDSLPGAPAQLPLGYQQSKWVAERLVLEAGGRGLPISVFRPGTVGPHTTTGCHNHNDLFMLLLRAASLIRSVPDVRAVDAAPVDWVVAMIASLSRRSEARGRTIHLAHPKPVKISRMLEWYKLGGNAMRLREFDGWLETVRVELGDDPDHPLSALRPILDSERGLEFCRLFNLAPPMVCERASELAELVELPCPPLDIGQMQRWEKRLRAEGMIDDPRDDFGRPRRYMWFRERLIGGATLTEGGRTPLELDFTASVASLRQMVEDRRIDLAGTVRCPALHPAPLHVREGHWKVRPHSGLGRRNSAEAALIFIRIELLDEDGRELWLEGEKVARARLDVWRQSRTFELRLGDANGVLATGNARVPGETWIEDQVYNVEFAPEVPEGERRRAKMLYLAWLGGNLGRTFYDLALRLGVSVVSGK